MPAPVEIAYGWATRGGRGTGYPLDRAVEDFSRWPDPEYANAALDGYFARLVAGDVDAVSESLGLIEASRAVARRDARAAFARIKVLQAASVVGRRDLYDDFEAAVADGRAADPASGLWDYTAVLESLRLQRASDATRYARAALRYPQTSENRVWLEAVIAGKAGLETE